MTTDNNPIIKKIPVYLNQSFEGRLSCYSFPTGCNVFLQQKASVVVSATIQDNTHEINLEIERDVKSNNFSRSKAEQLAINADGNEPNIDRQIFPNCIMDRMTFLSRSLKKNSCAIALYQDGEIHLTPIDEMMQFRPSLRYIDKGDKGLKVEVEDGEADEDEAQVVTVKFARQESDRAKRNRETSYRYLIKQYDSNRRYAANFFEPGTSVCDLHFRKLFCPKTSDKAIIRNFDLKCFKTSDNQLQDCSHGLTLKDINAMSNFSDRVRTLMLRTRLIDFTSLCELLKIDPTDRSKLVLLLQNLQQVAVLIKGGWVLQSELIFDKPITEFGLPSPLLKNARDYLLYLFNRNRFVSRKKYAEVAKLPNSIVQSLLEEVAVLRREQKEWEFKLPTDYEFMGAHPEVVQRQQVKWEMRYEQIVEGLRQPDAMVSPPPRQRRKSCRESVSSDNESGAESKRGVGLGGRKRKHRASFSSGDPLIAK